MYGAIHLVPNQLLGITRFSSNEDGPLEEDDFFWPPPANRLLAWRS